MAVLSQEVHMVREVLEGVLAPEVATSVMFAALQRHGHTVPQSPQDVLTLVRGPMREVLAERVSVAVRDDMISRIERVLAGEAQATDFSIDIDLDSDMEGEPSVTATMPIVWREPVAVVVLSGGDTFAHRLEASLGAARVHVTLVRDVARLRHSTFSKSPLLVFVDGGEPPAADPLDLARALHDLPAVMVSVLWGADLAFGRTLEPALVSTGANPVRIEERDGFEPLLDLILARYKADTLPPAADSAPPRE